MFTFDRLSRAFICFIVIICVIFCFTWDAYAINVHSQPVYDLLQYAIYDNGLKPSPSVDGIGHLKLQVNSGVTSRGNIVFLTIVHNAAPNAVWIDGNVMQRIRLWNAGGNGEYAYSTWKIEVANGLDVSNVNLEFRYTNTVVHHVDIIDFTAVANLNKFVGNIAGCYYTHPFTTAILQKEVSATDYFNFSDHYDLPFFISGQQYSGFVENVSFVYPYVMDASDYITFRFYVPSNSVDVSYDKFAEANHKWQFDLGEDSPVVGWSIGTSSSLTGAPASLTPIDEQITTTSNYYFDYRNAYCYDVTVDVHDRVITSPYIVLNVQLKPTSVTGSDDNNYTVGYQIRCNGGVEGRFDQDINPLSQYTSWYQSYIDSQISLLLSVSDTQYWGIRNTFSAYLDQILEALDQITSAPPEMQSAQDDIASNQALEQNAVASAQEGMSGVLQLQMPAPITPALGIISSVSTWLSSGSGLLLLMCLVLIPMAIGIISKLLNGGD